MFGSEIDNPVRGRKLIDYKRARGGIRNEIDNPVRGRKRRRLQDLRIEIDLIRMLRRRISTYDKVHQI